MTAYSQTDPSTWSRGAAAPWIVGTDLGMQIDYSTIVVGAVWPNAGHIIGVTHIQQLPLGTPMNLVADQVADQVRKHPGSRAVVDLTNNGAFAALLAARLGRNPGNHMVAAVLTAADTHALDFQPMPVSLAGVRAAIPRISLSKAELIETTGAELDNGSLRLAKVGDWEKLKEEFKNMERTVRKSGSVAYSAAPNAHDDLITALALVVFGCRRFGANRHRRIGPRREKMPTGAWT